MSSILQEHTIQSFREHVGEAFKAGTSTFPHYTLHGIEHLQELDRLARMFGAHIPKLQQYSELLGYLRVAICMHDFAMVDVPNKEREMELRKQMASDLSFADVVRKVHQDEILHSFSDPGRISYLTRLFGSSPHLLDDISTIARHHRYHSLLNAPDHLKGLCALMRIIDELDIGPNRSPFGAYEALRTSMDIVSKFHWLKHICTRPIEEDATFVVEAKGGLRILKVFVAVKATESSWQCLQSEIIQKLRACLHHDNVNLVLREAFQIQFEICPAPAQLCGATLFLDPVLKDDLNEVAGSSCCKGDRRDAEVQKNPLAEAVLAVNKEASLSLDSQPPEIPTARGNLSDQEFRIRAVPVKKINEFLCSSGRLTLIDNQYVAPVEDYLHGTQTTDNRFYVGPADIGKTRAALEWIHRVCKGNPQEWLILRTEYGSIPERIEQIVLDTSMLTDGQTSNGSRAILFLDDLPTNLPVGGRADARLSAIQRLFQWYSTIPLFKERRIVGTIRSEEVRLSPELPKQMTQIGWDVALVALKPLNSADNKRLWQGMVQGSVIAARNSAPFRYQIDISDGFLNAIVDRRGDPEAIATFVQQAVAGGKTKLTSVDVHAFADNAVKIWLTQTWPMIERAYGLPAKVFFTLARFLEGGVRKSGPFVGSLTPAWQFHEVFGQDLCREIHHPEENYLSTIEQLLQDGYAVGDGKQWIRPRWDFLLQADDLPGVDLHFVNYEWFAQRASRLSKIYRSGLAAHFSASGVKVVTGPTKDAAWEHGIVIGLEAWADHESNAVLRQQLRTEAISRLRTVANFQPPDSDVIEGLGIRVAAKSEEAKTNDERRALLVEASQLLNRAITADENNSSAWYNLGIALSKRADLAKDDKAGLLNDAMTAFHRAFELKSSSEYSAQIGNCYDGLANSTNDEAERLKYREQGVLAWRKAIEIDPKNSGNVAALSYALCMLAELEKDPNKRTDMRLEASEAGKLAVSLNPRDLEARQVYYQSILLRALFVEDGSDSQELEKELLKAAGSVLELNPADSRMLSALSRGFRLAAKKETDFQTKLTLLKRAVALQKKAVTCPPRHTGVRQSLGECFEDAANIDQRPTVQREYLKDALREYRLLLKSEPNSTALLLSTLRVHRKLVGIDNPDFHVKNALELSRRWVGLAPSEVLPLVSLADWLCRAADLPQNRFNEALRMEAVAACRVVADEDPMSEALSSQLAHLYRITKKQEYLDEAIELARKAQASKGRIYQLACVAAAVGKRDDALTDLAKAFSTSEISVDHVRKDPDWLDFRADDAWLKLLASYSEAKKSA